MTSEPLQLIRAQIAAIAEVARLAELRLLAVQAERLARINQQILKLKYAEAKKRAAADKVAKRIRPQIMQALPISLKPPELSSAPEEAPTKKLQGTVLAGKQTTRKPRKSKTKTMEAV